MQTRTPPAKTGRCCSRKRGDMTSPVVLMKSDMKKWRMLVSWWRQCSCWSVEDSMTPATKAPSSEDNPCMHTQHHCMHACMQIRMGCACCLIMLMVPVFVSTVNYPTCRLSTKIAAGGAKRRTDACNLSFQSTQAAVSVCNHSHIIRHVSVRGPYALQSLHRTAEAEDRQACAPGSR